MPTTTTDVDEFVEAAAAASAVWGRAPIGARVAALRGAAAALDSAADELVAIAARETHLAEARLRGELTRTTFQLRLFGDVLREGAWLDARIDHADPGWPMGAPRPDLRRQLEPIGPVLVFAASNFPFAFSVAGGDTASALAAGCAVVLKAHPGHPELSARTTEVVRAGLDAAGAPVDLLTTIVGDEAGVRALRHPLIAAAGFTGSIAGGRALFDIAAGRPAPIPFYGELGSVNPAFVTRAAAAARPEAIVAGFVGAVGGSAGQLCTKPGLLVVPRDQALLDLLAAAALPEAVPLLNDRIADGFAAAVAATAAHPGVETLAGEPGGVTPVLFATTAAAVLGDPEGLVSEMFGPAAIVAVYDDDDEAVGIARRLEGQLTATVVADEGDHLARELLPILATKAGRVLWNQWPTGVSVTWAQQHGGPYPATTIASTSVGTAALERWLRPVAYQNVPDALLPPALQESNPLGIPRRVDGVLSA